MANEGGEARKRGRPSKTGSPSPTPEEEKADAAIGKLKRIVLSALIAHYYETIDNPQQKGRDLKSLTAARASFKRAHFDNFLHSASELGAAAIFDHFKKRFHDDATYYSESNSEFARGAIQEVYGEPPGTVSPHSPARLFAAFSDMSPARAQRVASVYQGVWHIFRYAGHGREHRKIMWSVIQIDPIPLGSKTGIATFKIIYRPENKPRASVEGSIIPFRQSPYLLFLGYDPTAKFPVDMLAEERELADGEAPLTEFGGLIKRKHERGLPMVARVLFLRAKKGEDLRQAAANVDAYTEAELKKDYETYFSGDRDRDFESDLNKIQNHVPYDGKNVLMLIP